LKDRKSPAFGGDFSAQEEDKALAPLATLFSPVQTERPPYGGTFWRRKRISLILF